MKLSVNLLNLIALTIGLLSAVILSVDTIGLKKSIDILRFLTSFNRKVITTTNPNIDPKSIGIPPLALFCSLVIFSAEVALWYVSPGGVTSAGIVAAIVALAILPWILTGIIYAVLVGVFKLLAWIYRLTKRQHAGWVGFGLLAVSFAIQFVAATAQWFYESTAASAVDKTI